LINAFAVKGKKQGPQLTAVGFLFLSGVRWLRGINAMDQDVMSAPKKPEEDWSPTWREKLRERKFAHESRMIIAGMGNSQTVLLLLPLNNNPAAFRWWSGLV